MDPQDSRQRIMDSAAVGPMQFTQSQRTYIDDMPHVGRTDPMPPQFNFARQHQDDDGTCYYEDMESDGDSWVIPGGSFGRDFMAVSP